MKVWRAIFLSLLLSCVAVSAEIPKPHSSTEPNNCVQILANNLLLGESEEEEARVIEDQGSGVFSSPNSERLKLLIKGYLAGSNPLHFEIASSNFEASKKLILERVSALRQIFALLHPDAPQHYEINTSHVWVANNRWFPVVVSAGLSAVPWVHRRGGKSSDKAQSVSRRAFFSIAALCVAAGFHTSGVMYYTSSVEAQLKTLYAQLSEFENAIIEALSFPERQQSPRVALEMKFSTRVDTPGQESHLELELVWHQGLPTLRAVSRYFKYGPKIP